jgi:hypothetical protein
MVAITLLNTIYSVGCEAWIDEQKSPDGTQFCFNSQKGEKQKETKIKKEKN